MGRPRLVRRTERRSRFLRPERVVIASAGEAIQGIVGLRRWPLDRRVAALLAMTDATYMLYKISHRLSSYNLLQALQPRRPDAA
jgi:hypothetical protein